MPIYEYECENKHRFEVWQSMKDDPVKDCPTCGTPVHKIFHPAGIIFKGSGWYITDSRKPSSESASESKDSGSGSSTSKSEAKSEPKSDSKSESKSDSAPSKPDSSG